MSFWESFPDCVHHECTSVGNYANPIARANTCKLHSKLTQDQLDFGVFLIWDKGEVLCNHSIVVHMGVHQCRLCGQTYRLGPDNWLEAEPSKAPPESDAGKLELIRELLPDLELNASTKGVARKLRGILGVWP